MKPRMRYHWGHGRWYHVGGPVRRHVTWRWGELPYQWPCPYKEAAKLLWPDKDKPA
jgi:hypothetical protein